jgi:purine nucleoside phosphorylase
MGWHVVNMTQYPEVTLARELELCYMNLSYVTDYDVAAKQVAALRFRWSSATPAISSARWPRRAAYAAGSM